MNFETTMKLAKEAGFGDSYPYQASSLFQRFAALVAAHEREQCAKAVESLEAKLPSLEDYEDTGAYLVWEVSQKHDDRWIEQPIAAAAIRSRKDAP